MADLLLELFSEEIPARMQPRAEDDLKRLLGDALKEVGLAAKNIDTYSTPRRITAHVTGLPVKTADISEERRGPKVGAPAQAAPELIRKTSKKKTVTTTPRLTKRVSIPPLFWLKSYLI